MNKNLLVALLGVTALAFALVFWLAGGQRPETLRSEELLLPELRDQVNDIESITLTGAGERTIATLVRARDRWRVIEEHEYEADFELVLNLLKGLAEARLTEPKTARAEWYPRLGVEDVTADDAGGLRVAFPDTDLPAVIVGFEAAGPGGHYVRKGGDEQSWLIDQTLELPATSLEWLERGVMDIPRGEIESVVIRHPDGEVVRVRGTGLEEGAVEFVLLDVPEGREAEASWRIARVADGLANMRLEGVRPAGEIPDDAVRALYVTGDQLEFVASLFEDDEGHWVHFQVTADTPPLGEDEHLTGEDSETLIDAVAVDARLSPWWFKIPASKFETMTPRMEDLLVALDDEVS